MDHAGPFQGNLFFIVVDSCSKWLEVVRVPSTSTEGVICALRTMFSTHGVPDTLVSDNGTCFTSAVFQDFVDRNGIRHVLISPRHPASDGQAERMVQSTKNSLRRIIIGDWPLRLARYLFSQHVTPNSTTGKSPAELLFSRRLRSCLDKLHPDYSHEDKMEVEARQDEAWVDPRRRVFHVSDPVYVKGAGAQRWIAARISAVTGPVSYVVLTDSGQIRRCHVNQLRKRVPVEVPREPYQTPNGRSAEFERNPPPNAEVPIQPELEPSVPPEPVPDPVDPDVRLSRRLSSRQRRLPGWTKDFVWGKEC